MPSCSAPAGAASGVPRSPRGLQVPSGVLRLAPVSPLFLAGTLGSRSGVSVAGGWPSGCLRPSELWDELRGSKVWRDSGLLGCGWTSALASEVQPGRPIDLLKARRWAGRGATPQPFSDGNLHYTPTHQRNDFHSLFKAASSALASCVKKLSGYIKHSFYLVCLLM